MANNPRTRSLALMGSNNDGGFGNERQVMPRSSGSHIDQMVQRHHNMHKEFDRMANQMMENFGMGQMMKMSDPFANDPFFSGGIDNMMSQMRKEMKQGMDAPGIREQMGKMGSGKFVQQSIVSSTKQGTDGKPMHQAYHTKATGAFGGGNRVTERHQMYEDTGTGHQKMAHERMLNGMGRKMVQERVGGRGGEEYSHNKFKGMLESDAARFDQEWDQMANHLGFDSHMHKRIGFASGGGDAYANQSYGGFGGGRQNERAAHEGYQDNQRRGHFLPANARAANAPVRLGGPPALPERGRRDIAPTMPTGGPGFGAPVQAQSNNARPHALPPSNEVRPQRQVAGARAQPAAAQQQARVHRQPAAAKAQPARAG